MNGWKPFEKRGRGWLEPHNLEVDSYVTWKVEVTKDYTSSELKIADCTRSISLWFNVEEDGLQKLDRLVGYLQEYRAALVQASKRLEKRP